MPGTPKLLLPFPDEPIIRRSVTHALESGVRPVAVVVESATGPIAGALEGLSVTILENPDAATGASTSIRVAAGWALALGSALVVTLGDEPGIDPQVVRRVADAWRADPLRSLRARYDDRVGHPVVLSDRALRAASDIAGDRGLGSHLDGPDDGELAIPGPAPIDVDTEPAYREALARLTH
ncbi:MAG: NTP transferase domain-containing protein [Gemmatimonadetes bacterium]|nr:NTP transferase domain-containing protein [Gemmatimonadota bacterium]